MSNIAAQKTVKNWTLKINKDEKDFYYPYFLTIENNKTGFSDYPIMYESKDVVYDCPEKIPNYTKRLCLFMLEVIDFLVIIENWKKEGYTYPIHEFYPKHEKFMIENNLLNQ